MGDEDDKWSDLLEELLIIIVEKIGFPDNTKFAAVCKSWKLATIKSNVPLPPKSAYLLLAEGPITTLTDDELEDEEDEEEYEEDEEEYEEDEDQDNIDEARDEEGNGKNTQGDKNDCVISEVPDTIRGMFSLSTQITYVIDLPEALGKLVLGTKKGWLFTLGRDLQINLLHPFSRKQIPLPDMLTFPAQYEYSDNFPPQRVFDMFVEKVAMSSRVPTKYDNIPPPIVMAIYGEQRILAFARLGDQVWTNVNGDSHFKDIVYHKEHFYAVDFRGDVFICDIDDDDAGKTHRARKIVSAPLKTYDWNQKYLVESVSGSDILQIVRYRRGLCYGSWSLIKNRKYHTTDFSVWKLEIKDLDSPLYSWREMNDLGNESLFIGRTSSFSMPASEGIKPNCIYFTDDSEFFGPHNGGGGKDMGIFDMRHRTIEPHFPRKSVHPFAPPLWYI